MNAAKHATLWVAVASYLLLSVGYAVTTPAFESPDESDHFRYASYLAHAGHMPYIPGTAARHGGIEGLDEEHLAHHPPLYYWILAVAMHAGGHGDTTFSLRKNPDFNQSGRASRHLVWVHGHDEKRDASREIWLLRVLRFLSVACGLGTLLCTWRLGLLAFPDRQDVASLAVLLMAGLPMWSFMHGALDNGNLATLLSHGVLLATCAALLHGSFTLAHGVGIGLLTGLALISKLNSLFLVPLLAVAYGWCFWRCPGRRGRTLASGLVALALMLAVAGWFFLRNEQIYGDPFAEAAHSEAYADSRLPARLAREWLLGGFLPALAGSLLGNLGWMVLPMPPWLVWAALLLLGAGLVGLAVAGRRRPDRSTLVVLGFLGLACLLVFLITARFNMRFGQPQGRYLFPALGPAMLLLAFGLQTLGGRWLAAGCSVALPLVGLWVLCFWFQPAFDPALTPSSPYRAALAWGITRAPAPGRETIQLASPADATRCKEPPLLRWRSTAGTGSDALYTVHAFTREGRILFATFEWFHERIHGEQWQVPANGWELLPKNVPIQWTVRRVPNRADGETTREMPASGIATFVKVE